MSKSNTRKAKKGARIPVQQRGIDTKRRLLEAAGKAFAKYGYHDVTADEIAGGAGVAVGSFYAYFSNKREIFLEIIDDYTKRGIDTINQSLATSPIKKTQELELPVRKMIIALVDMHMESPELLKESLRMALYDEEIGRRVERVNRLVIRLLEEALANASEKLKKQDRESIAYMLYYASEGVVHRIALNKDDINERKVVRELSRMVASYINEKL